MKIGREERMMMMNPGKFRKGGHSGKYRRTEESRNHRYKVFTRQGSYLYIKKTIL